MDAWWALPGPKALLDRMVHDLEDGRSVVLGRPMPGPAGAVDVVASRWRADWWRWLSEEETPNRLPTETLIERFCPDVANTDGRSLDCLLSSERVGDVFCVIRIADEARWDEWRAFLGRLESAAKDRPRTKRPTFLIEVIGEAATRPLVSGTTAVWHEWADDISSRDTWAYAASLLERDGTPTLVRQVQSAVISELSLWDASMAQALARLSLDDLFDPADFLEEIGTARGWRAGDEIEPRSAWAAGCLGKVDGWRRWHSALLAVQHRRSEIRRRVWHGQVAALFPLIEDLKMAAANALRRHLRPPFTENGRTVTEITHLEVGSLWFYVNKDATRGSVPAAFREGIGDLRAIRNSLAHVRPISATALQSPRIRALAEMAFSQSLA